MRRLPAVLALLCLPLLALAAPGDFIPGNGTLPGPWVTQQVCPFSNPNACWTSGNANTIRDSLNDLRTNLLNGANTCVTPVGGSSCVLLPGYMAHPTGDASAATVTATGGIVARSQAERARDDFQVQEYATCDGSTDATAGVQNAINDAVAAHGRLLFPRGLCKVTSTLSVSGATSVVIQGRGPGSGLVAPSLGANTVVSITGSTAVTFSDLQVTGTFLRGVYVGTSSKVSVERLHVSGHTVDNASPGGGVVFDDTADCAAVDNVISGGGTFPPTGGGSADILSYYGNPNLRLTVRGNRCTSTTVLNNIILFNAQGAKVTGNYSSGARTPSPFTSSGYGIALYYISGVSGGHVVEGNTVEHVEGSCIYLQNQPDSTVAGNVASDCASVELSSTLQVGGVAIGAPGASVAVIGNRVNGSGRSCISVGGFGHTVAGNTVKGCGEAGILLRDAQRVAVTGNAITDAAILIRSIPSPATVGATIVGNVGWSSRTASACMSLEGLLNSTVADNTMSLCGGEGAALASTDNVELRGNLFVDGSQAMANGYPAISLNGATRTTVALNLATNTGGTGFNYGVREFASGDMNEVTGNRFRSMQTAPYSLSGAGTSASGNKMADGAIRGVTTLVGGTKTISTTETRLNEPHIRLTRVLTGGTRGDLYVSNPLAGSFVIQSSSGSDISTVGWEIVH